MGPVGDFLENLYMYSDSSDVFSPPRWATKTSFQFPGAAPHQPLGEAEKIGVPHTVDGSEISRPTTWC